jgi:hypothetical protein
MPKSTTTIIDMLAKVFKNTALPWDAATFLSLHLHTADPGAGGASTVSEATYAGYAVVNVARTGGGWTGTAPVANAALLQFPQCSSPGANVITHISITPQGSTQVLYRGALTASLTVDNGIQPQFAIGGLTVNES